MPRPGRLLPLFCALDEPRPFRCLECGSESLRIKAFRLARTWHGACVGDGKSITLSVAPMRLLLIAAALISTWTALPGSAAVVLSDDIGGKMEEYNSKFQQLRRSGEAVVIDGKCYSACTMILGLLPPNRVCATSNAVFGFHAAWMFATG